MIETFNNIASEPIASWGGSWTEDKLDTFEKYVNAYLTIMNAYRDKYNWKLVYFDGFAGSGSRINDNGEDDSKELMLELLIEKVNEPITKIAELYIKQLKTIFKYVTTKPMVLYNSRNTPIFHFAFASNNETAKNIAAQIIKKKQ